jgi:hypothetical protein
VNGDEHVHVQKFQVRRATGEAIAGKKGELLIEGDTGKVQSKSGIRGFVGIAPDMFAADAVAMRNLQNAFYNEHRYDGDAFLRHRQNFFDNRNITAIRKQMSCHGTHVVVIDSGLGNARIQAVHSWKRAKDCSQLLAGSILATLRRIARGPCTRHTTPASWGRLVQSASRAADAPPQRESSPGQDQPPRHRPCTRRHAQEAAL